MSSTLESRHQTMSAEGNFNLEMCFFGALTNLQYGAKYALST